MKRNVPNLRSVGSGLKSLMAEQLRILSLNTNGLANSVKRGGLYVWLDKFHDKKNSIIMLQETHSTLNSEDYWRKEWKGKVFFAHGTSKSRGVATLIPESIDFKLAHIYEDDEGRYLIMVIEICETWVVLINCYAPTIDKPVEQMEWLNKIQLLIEEHSDLPVIMGGDLNDCLIPKLDKYNAKPNVIDTQYVKAIKTLQAEYDLLDIWRILNPDVRKYTWRQGKQKKNLRQSRLDYWLISSQLAYALKQVDIEPGFKSDHSLISLVLFRSDITKRGPGMWKFNNSLLRDKKYVESINKVMDESFEKYSDIQDRGLGWEMVKMEIRSSTILFSKNKARENREQITAMIKEVGILEQIMNNDPSQDEMERYYNAQKEIELYNIEKANGVMVRAKADQVEFGEKNSKFFLNLEKRNAAKKSITKLIDEKENEITGKDEILDYEKAFYLKLYSEHESNDEEARAYREARDFFMNDEIPGICGSDNEKCDRDITMDEIGAALKELKNGKSPGTDGLTTDFYKFFWVKIRDQVIASLLNVYEKKEMSIEQNRGVISLIPKKDKDPRYIKNWRPVSLLNTDYKILTKTLAERMKGVLKSVINPSQVAYLKDRYIGCNIRTIVDVMEFTDEHEMEGIIAFLDFEKAFDTMKWQAIDDTLSKLNFGIRFRNWIKAIYRQSETCVTNNGYNSSFFKLGRGVRQGCPLSAYLFITVVELMAIKIRNSVHIQGIKIAGKETKIAQMADDTTLVLQNLTSLQGVMNILRIFEAFAGLKLNKIKSEAMWLGSKKYCKMAPYNLKWVKEVHSLGICFSYDNDMMDRKNFIERYRAFDRILNFWAQRNLSLMGRITILKSLAFSTIIYQCANLLMPENIIKDIETSAYNFVWAGVKDKIKRGTLIGDFEDGGLRMLDIRAFIQAQRVMWAKRLADKEVAQWKFIPMHMFEKLLGCDTFKISTGRRERPREFNKFYWEVFKAWLDVKNNSNMVRTAFDVRREYIWLNKEIKVEKKEVNGRNG